MSETFKGSSAKPFFKFRAVEKYFVEKYETFGVSLYIQMVLYWTITIS